jgi:hypothetical protein
MKEKNLQFNQVKQEISGLLKSWEENTTQLQKAEEKYS